MSSEDERTIFNYFNRHPRTSLRTAENRLGHPKSSIQIALRNSLHIVQYLEERDYEARAEFANLCLEDIKLYSSFLNRINFSVDYVFHVNGKVNKHNVRTWGSENTHKT